jgi:uncharacterized membrane protein YfcA
MLFPFIIVGLAAFAVSTLTLFSGFGLGTLMMPVFALFFPVPIAVASTAVIHVSNSFFKATLLRQHARKAVLLRFGVPAIGMAFLGAGVLTAISAQPALFVWHLGGRAATVTPIKLVMGILIIAFALIELVPRLRAFRVSPRWLPLGGAISGFFGGLSGHQGAFRAAFLSPLGLSPPEFAATQAVLACFVDAARLVIYAGSFLLASTVIEAGEVHWGLVGCGILCAFAGVLAGRRLLPSVRIDSVRRITGVLLLAVGAGLGSGLA